MIEFSRLSVLIVAELLLALSLLSGILVTLWGMRASRIRQAARHLVERIQSEKATRTQRLRERLAEHYRYEGESLEQAVHDLTQAEMRLYQNTINSYLQQDVVAFQQTDVDVENLVLAYQQLNLPEEPGEAFGELPVSGDESAEMKRLRDENTRLSEELGVTMDTMGRMLNEYSYMFAGGASNHQDKEQTKGASLDDRQAPAQATAEPPGSAEGGSPVDADETAGMQAEVSEASVSDVGTATAEQTATQENAVSSIDGKPDRVEAPEADNISAMQMQAEGSVGAEAEMAAVDDSLMEELEQIDIDILEPQQTPEVEHSAELLEEEWARALEEDLAIGATADDNPAGKTSPI